MIILVAFELTLSFTVFRIKKSTVDCLCEEKLGLEITKILAHWWINFFSLSYQCLSPQPLFFQIIAVFHMVLIHHPILQTLFLYLQTICMWMGWYYSVGIYVSIHTSTHSYRHVHCTFYSLYKQFNIILKPLASKYKVSFNMTLISYLSRPKPIV